MDIYFPINKFRSNETYLSDEIIEKLDREIYLMGKDGHNIHSVYVVHEGFCIYERYYQTYNSEDLHKVYSITKSITSLLIGILIEQGIITNLDMSICNILKLPHKITIRELLDMNSGLVWNEHESMKKTSGKFKRFINSASPLEFIGDMNKKPGMGFNYNSLNSHLLSYVIRELTGFTPQEFARENLFKPLGIGTYLWEADAEGVGFGGHGLSLKISDLGKIGYLVLMNGKWQDKQIVSKKYLSWINKKSLYTGLTYDYSLHWWIKKHWDRDILMAIGYGGQKVFVDKENNLVVVVNAMISRRKQNEVDRVFEIIKEKFRENVDNG